MCGITGLLHFQKLADAESRVGKMTTALAHRGPDAEGFYQDPCISLGHRRLSIIDLSTAANQPFQDPDGQYVLVFNGEIYNYQEIKQELKDYPFQTSSDTEVLMAAFKQWGIESVKKLKGMFAFALWDKREEALYLVRDRMGVKPLVYFFDNGILAFSSERRSLLASGLIAKKLNRYAVVDFLTYQSTGYPDTMVQDILELKAGTWMKINRHKAVHHCYWKLANVQANHDINREQVQEKLFELLSRSVSSRMMTDVPLGVFLSGGIDSSSVVALMQLQSKDRINTFNLSFTEKEFDESPFAETIVQRFGTRHRKHILQSDEYLSQITAALDAMDSPSMDGVNTYVLSTAIRQSGIKVAMTGIGGDELFVGYPGFFQYKKMMASKKGLMFSQWGRKGMSIFLKAKHDNRSHRMAGVLSVDQLSIDQLYPSLRTVLSDFHLHQYTRLETNRKGLQKMLKEDLGNANGWGDFSTYSMAEYLGYTQKTLLKDADQMSMAVGLEIREPFFDHELVEFVLSLPDEMKYPHYPKQLLVEALDPLLPAEIVHRKKQGFVFPWEHWMKKELQSFCTAAINNIAERDFINGEALQNHWKRFQMGDPAIHWTEPWLFVVLSNWLNKQGIS